MPKLTTKGRVTIPLRIRRALRLQTGDRVDFVEVAKGQFAMRPLKRQRRKTSRPRRDP
ncbi:MAG TPA: AbrB/MazE/SpoVT family DNA-binding domain-containing protein [Candidatus Eremiobacteraceae bacterium]|nr:AbrB/MazE/SpoVT family DNA-binding domain-containing protein [Candidatus Eremiobacteraceae bacterium]